MVSGAERNRVSFGAPGPPPALCRNGIVDVGHLDGVQRCAFPCQPEEAVDGAAVVLYGRRGKGRALGAATSPCCGWCSCSGSSSHPKKRSHWIPRQTKRVLALGDADRSHLRAFGCDQTAVTASICERPTLLSSFSFRRRTKLN